MSFAVMIHEKGGQPRRQEFDKNEVTIGRVQGNDIILPKQNVSKRHSRIVIKDGKFIIVDLKSTNGTYVNGRKIASPMVIKETDKIYIGDFILSAEPLSGGAEKAAPAEPAIERKPPPPPPRPKAVSKPQPPEPAAAPEPPKPRREPSPPPVHEEPVASPPTIQKAKPARPATPAPAPIEVAQAPIASPASSAEAAATAPLSAGQLFGWVRTEAHRMGLNPPAGYPASGSLDDEARTALTNAAATALDTGDQQQRATVAAAVVSEVFTLGSLAALLEDDDIEGIFANGPDEIWVTRAGKRELTENKMSGVDALLGCVELIFNGVGASLNRNGDFSQTYMADGSRVHLALTGSGTPYLTIDRPAKRARTIKELIKDDILSKNMGAFLESAFLLGRNIIIASNDINSRFELIAALIATAPDGCRVVSAESGGRLPKRAGHVVLTGSAHDSNTSLVAQAIKMAPDRLVVPDCAGPEVLRALTALGGAVEGGVIGVDAESPEDALIRLSRQAGLGVVADTSQVEAMVTDRADVLVQILNYADGGPRVSQIMDLDGEVREVFTGFETFAGAGYVPRWYENAHIVGHELDQDIFN